MSAVFLCEMMDDVFKNFLGIELVKKATASPSSMDCEASCGNACCINVDCSCPLTWILSHCALGPVMPLPGEIC